MKGQAELARRASTLEPSGLPGLEATMGFPFLTLLWFSSSVCIHSMTALHLAAAASPSPQASLASQPLLSLQDQALVCDHPDLLSVLV